MRYLLFIFTVIILTYCESSEDNSQNKAFNNGWAIDTSDLTGTSIVKDAFPIVTNPSYTTNKNINLSEKEKVVAIRVQDSILVYPLRYMGVEVLNDKQASLSFAVTYCPITKSAYVLKRNIDNQVLTFSASGILYKDNLIFYDLETETLWSQMLFKGINGKFLNETVQTVNSIETVWGTIKNHFSKVKIFTGFYDSTGNSSVKRIDPDDDIGIGDDLYNEDEKVFGALNFSIIYTKSYSEITRDITIKNHDNLVFASSRKYNFIAGYNNLGKNFSSVNNNFPVIMKDQTGIQYDIFGYPVSNNQAPVLLSTYSYEALWWAWTDFYNNFMTIE